MTKILIADDEPLVQAGIRSMINWESRGYEIVGIASNGAMAYDMIVEQSPEIVITDIKMPIMTGLELAQKCYEEGRELPVFIILTSYEEFTFVKEALKYGVSDYLVKLELTPDSLLEALGKAQKQINSHKKSDTDDGALSNYFMLTNQFYMRLLLNLFDSEQQMLNQAKFLKLNMEIPAYSVCYVEITSDKIDSLDEEQTELLCTSTLQMTKELVTKYLSCYVLSLDIRHFCIIFSFDNADFDECKNTIKTAFDSIRTMLFNYYSVALRISFGGMVNKPILLHSSYQEAKWAFPSTDAETPVVYAPELLSNEITQESFNFSLFRESLRKAFAEYDGQAFSDIIHTVVDLFDDNPAHFVQAFDAAANILYLSLSLLSNGEQTISEIYADSPHGYRSLYEFTTTSQVTAWLEQLGNGISRILSEHSKDYKNHIVNHVKNYVQEHITEKITLNSIAETFNISPSYLSSLFSKYNDVGFNDYVNQQKVERSKEMLASGKYKIYEISDVLGFENSFYFSRVFKKISGVSPRDYLNQLN